MSVFGFFVGRARRVSVIFACLALGCAGSTQQGPQPHAHGTITPLSLASSHDWKPCQHKVPEEVCVRCKPERIPAYKARHDWCDEHHVPESQCLQCHPDLDFSPPKPPPQEADVKQLVKEGEDLPALEPHVVAGKVTIFDFHAAWCPPCRKVDEHLYPTLEKRFDIALRKIDIGSWDTPVSERWLKEVPELPFLVIYGKNGKKVGTVSGANFAEIDRLIAEASK